MLVSWHRNAFYITGPLWGESIAHRCITCHHKSGLIRWVSPSHDDVMTNKRFLYYWPFVRRIHCSSVYCPHKGPETRSFRVSFVVSLKMLLNKPSVARDLRSRDAHVASLYWDDCLVLTTQRKYFPNCKGRYEFKSYMSLQWRRVSDIMLSKSSILHITET